LNSIRSFQTLRLEHWLMIKTKLSAVLLTAAAASVMASQGSYAAVPIPVKSEMMQLVHDEHDLVAECDSQ
jgi:hypothetical protein